MKSSLLVSLLIMMFIVVGCSEKKGATLATLKINLSNIANISSSSTIGSGGIILFGRSSAGEQFGKVVTGAEENLELSNGDWNFYAVMWTNNYSSMMSDAAYCGKSAQKLAGVATTVSLKLTNANCSDSDFSNGKSYLDTYSSKYYFPKLFIEECEDITKAGSFGCNANNQGSARSYRMVFKSYKGTLGAPVLGAEKIASSCIPFSGGTSLHSNGMGVNFPTGSSSSMPFVVSVEMYLGSDDCSASDPKGMYTHTFNLGLSGFQPGINRMLASSPNACSSRTLVTDELTCVDYLGTISSGACTNDFPMVIERFLPDSTCDYFAGASTVNYIKQMVSIPKDVVCGGFLNSSVTNGDNPFAGGKGVLHRPYKICNEWQINQIGERNTEAGSYDTAHYKLINDLDMNKASNIPIVGVYAAPACAGVASSGVDTYHNLNPLDGHLCGTGVTTTDAGFLGVFDGGGHTIANGRITAKNLSKVGFVRLLGTRDEYGTSGIIKKLKFKNLSVRGSSNVGGIAGDSNGNGLISDVSIDGLDVEGGEYTAGVVGFNQGDTLKAEKLMVKKAKVRGRDHIGGLFGRLCSSIKDSMFSGVVTSDKSSNESELSGGLAGIVESTGRIETSFSEGFIATNSTYVGGIAGRNLGNLSNIYSTMVLSTQKMTMVKGGGITAHNRGNISNCFSDTKLFHKSVNDFYYSGTVYYNEGGGVSNCYTDATNLSSHTLGSYDNLRSASWLSTYFQPALEVSSVWKLAQSNGSTPRLAWEDRECLLASNLLSVPSQVSTLSRGTQSNPVVICTASQLLSLSNRSSSEHYRLAESINLSSWGVNAGVADGVASLNGKFNGDGNILYGLNQNITNVSDGAVGIFKYITSSGSVSNLNLIGNSMDSAGDDVRIVGILANTNQGEIVNVQSLGSYVSANSIAGTLAGRNTGNIRDSKIHAGIVLGYSDLGGVVGENNTGTIQRVSANINMGQGNGGVTNIGGIAGSSVNGGKIDQVSVRGQMNFTSSPVVYLGGVVGLNDNSALSNAYAADLKMDLAITSSSAGVGGLVGKNTNGSAINNVFFLGRMRGTQSPYDLSLKMDVDSTTDERQVGPIVGKMDNGSLTGALMVANNIVSSSGSSLQVMSCGSTSINLSSDIGVSSGVFKHPSSPFLVPFTASGSTLTFSGLVLEGTCQTGTSVELFEAYHNYAEHGDVLSIPGFSLMANYTSRGFNIAHGDSNVALAYHLAKMNNKEIPSSAPVWVMNDEEDYPKLLQVDN